MSHETHVFVQNGSRRIGRLGLEDSALGEKSFRCEVTWSDGSTSKVSNRDGTKARLGGITLLRKAYPEELKSAWSDESAAPLLLALLLVDYPETSTKVNLLKSRLGSSTMGGPTVKEVWERSRKAFEALDGVRVTGSGPSLTYSWRGPKLPTWLPSGHEADWAHVLDHEPGALPASNGRDQESPAGSFAATDSLAPHPIDPEPARHPARPTSVPNAQSPSVELQEGDAPPKARRNRAQVGPDSGVQMNGSLPDADGTARTDVPSDTQAEASAAAPGSSRARREASDIWKSIRSRGLDDPTRESELDELLASNLTKLDRFLAQLIFGGQDAGAEELVLDARSQLSTTIATAADVKRALEALDTEPRVRVERALILTDIIGTEQRTEWASSNGAASQLGALARRVHVDSGLDRAVSVRRLARAVEALTTAPQIPEDILEAADIIDALTPSISGTAAAAVSTYLAAITRGLAAGYGTRQQVKRLGLRIADLPWTDERVRLAAAIGRLDPGWLTGTDWLKGITADDLVKFDQLFPPLLKNARWHEKLQATAESAVRAVESRRRLLLLLSSTTVASLVSADTATGGLRRTAQTDPALREWLAGISQTEVIESLETKVARETTAALAARDLVRQRDDQIQALASSLADAQRRLAHAAESHSTARDSTLAQAERDAYRLLAMALSTVETTSGQLDPESLVAKLRQQVRRRGIEPIGERGETVRFDPSLHEAPGGRPNADSPAIVGRSGYIWIRGDQREVLVKALVTGEPN